MNFETKIKEYFEDFNKRFFDDKLHQVKLESSNKMITAAGIFIPKRGKQKVPRIRLNRRLLENRADKEIMETLLHEMTHAFLFQHFGENVVKPHGTEFRQKINEINKALSINIKTTHRYVTWYRCDGKCRDLYSARFGYVSKLVNVKPDFDQNKNHKKSCGGKFHEVEEPPAELLKMIMQHHKTMKSKRHLKKKKAQESNGDAFTRFSLLNHRSENTVDYITSDDEA